MDVTLFVVRVWVVQYREELILNVTVFIVRFWGEQYREESGLNICRELRGQRLNWYIIVCSELSQELPTAHSLL